MVRRFLHKHPRLSVALVAFAVVFVLFSGYAVWLLSEANELPWQEEPTRVTTGIVPFSDIPGFGAKPTEAASPAAVATP